MPKPDDLHEWVSFDDPHEARTWVFDVTFLTSDWTCIFGRGCRGVLTEDFSDAVQGCCSYGAHFTGDADVAHTRPAIDPSASSRRSAAERSAAEARHCTATSTCRW